MMGVWLFSAFITADLVSAVTAQNFRASPGLPEALSADPIGEETPALFIPPSEFHRIQNQTAEVTRMSVEDTLLSKVSKDWWDAVRQRLAKLKAMDQVPLQSVGHDLMALKAELDR